MYLEGRIVDFESSHRVLFTDASTKQIGAGMSDL